MRLQYFPKTESFTLAIPAAEHKMVQSLMNEHGFNFSTAASKPGEAVLFTKEPYAALTFFDTASDPAQAQLAPLKAQHDLSHRITSKAHIHCPADVEPWPFQRAGVEYAMSRPNVLIGDVPGLGKTVQAICIANEMRAERVLVICPASIRLQWIRKIREWTTMPWPYIVHPILTARNGVHPHANWTVTSYEMCRTPAIHFALIQGHYDLMIIDEAHFCKEMSSGRTKHILGGHQVVGDDDYVKPIAECCEKVVALTGTPLPNRPKEAYALARALCFDSIDWLSENAFCERFNPSRQIRGRGGAVVRNEEATGRVYELQNRLRCREKHGPNGVMPQLEMPIYDVIELVETGPVKQALKAESLLGIDPENFDGKSFQILGHISEVRRMMGLALAPQIADYVEMLLDGGEDKLVLFGWHIEVLDVLQRRLEKYGLVRIDGRTNPKQKQERVDLFSMDPKVRICLGNMQAMGVGTDGLQHAANHVLLAEPDWVPGNNQQAVDRLDRGGQQRKVQADIFVAPKSIASKILGSALRKNRVVHKTLDQRMWT
jgi:SWI/SNF-related matrix-associated actin-dependent regulator of chromatin subfamily A-like protein 1